MVVLPVRIFQAAGMFALPCWRLSTSSPDGGDRSWDWERGLACFGSSPTVSGGRWEPCHTLLRPSGELSRDVGSLIQHVFFFHLFILVRV